MDEITEYQDEERLDVRGPWLPETTADADWALKRLGECQAELAEVDALEEEAIRQVRERCEKLRASPRYVAGYFEARLKVWMEREKPTLLKGTKRSKGLVFGTVGWRAKPERLEVTNKDALAAWLDTLPVESGMVRLKREPEMRKIQEHFAATGEIPPGCEVKPAVDEPYVKAENKIAALPKGNKP